MTVLFIYDMACKEGTIADHINAIKKYTSFDVYGLNFRGDLPPLFSLDCFSCIVIHYSLIVCSDNYLTQATRNRLRGFLGVKAVFIQDEYRFINKTVEAFKFIGVDIIFSAVPQGVINKVYSPNHLPNAEKITVLTGYAPKELTQVKVKKLKKRKMDVVYRGRKLPAWYGALAQEKWQIGLSFLEHTKQIQLKTDIKWLESDRIYGDAWIKFLASAKAVLGVESGASVCDFTGDIQKQVDDYTVQHPKADFETLSDLFFKDIDGKVEIRVISPRCFEAAALRTLMILFEGDYSSILIPWRHYVPLKKDFSNLEEILDVLKDDVRTQEIVDNAYKEIACNDLYTYKHMMKQVDQCLQRAMIKKGVDKKKRIGILFKTFYSFYFKLLRLSFIFKCKLGYIRHVILNVWVSKILGTRIGSMLRKLKRKLVKEK